LVLLIVLVYACRMKNKMPYMTGREKRYAFGKKNTAVHMEDVDELPFYSILEIAKATDNFSIHNKIGEGGFGAVYKVSY
ncbi:G-type lectin S-receptor-like serine/threonine-protein kinase isoform X1, partial [Tanacetum coccineum]